MSSSTCNSGEKIGIIGGGPAGIAAAWFLMKKGYTDITVLEKEDVVGGKCKTVDYTDSNGSTRNYELGAEYITYAYDTIFSFMNDPEVKAPYHISGSIMGIMGGGVFKKAAKMNPVREIIPAAYRYLKFLEKYDHVISRPGNSGIAGLYPELTQSSADFVKNNHLEPLLPLFLVEQFGYGGFDAFPAVHLCRTVPLSTFKRSIIDEIPIIRSIVNLFDKPIAALADNGTQSIFEKMAEVLNRKRKLSFPGEDAVHTGAVVSKITKIEKGLEVTTSKGIHNFDKVICALPPNVLSSLMSYPIEEAKLLNKTQYHPYFVGCIDPVFNLDKAYYQNTNLGKPGHELEPTQFSKRYKPQDGPIVAFGYNWRDAEGMSNLASRAELDNKLRTYCKENMNIESFTYLPGSNPDLPGYLWSNYHPHVAIKDFQEGYFDKLEALQGNHGVYLTGSGMASESLESTCGYSKHVVDRFF